MARPPPPASIDPTRSGLPARLGAWGDAEILDRMGESYAYRDAWGKESQSPTVENFHGAIRKLVSERFAATGRSWEECVHDRSLQLSREDFERIEAELLASGHRFEASAT